MNFLHCRIFVAVHYGQLLQGLTFNPVRLQQTEGGLSESTEVRHKLHAEHEWLPFFRSKDRRLAGDTGGQ